MGEELALSKGWASRGHLPPSLYKMRLLQGHRSGTVNLLNNVDDRTNKC